MTRRECLAFIMERLSFENGHGDEPGFVYNASISSDDQWRLSSVWVETSGKLRAGTHTLKLVKVPTKRAPKG